MNLETYEKYVNSRSMSIVKKIQGDYEIYISDGFSRQADQDHNEAHYKTMYAFGNGDTVFLGEFYTTPMLTGQTPDDRIRECEVRAREQLQNFRKNGCLK